MGDRRKLLSTMRKVGNIDKIQSEQIADLEERVSALEKIIKKATAPKKKA